MRLNFCSCFFNWYSSRYCKFCNNNKNFCYICRKYKSVIKKKKKKKKNDKTVLLVKNKLNTVDVLISKALIDSNISHDEFASVNNVLKEYDDTKEEIKKF